MTGVAERQSDGTGTASRSEWLRQWASDPDLAVDTSYRTHASAVRARACSICGPDLAADVVQEVFLRLWRAPEHFDPERGSLRTYLLVVARGVSIDAVRSDRRRRRRDERGGSSLFDVAADEHALLEPLVADEARRRVTHALAQLASGPRTAIEAIFFDELTVVESARRCRIPEGTIKSRMRSGLHQLRPLLADLADPGDPGDTADPGDTGDTGSRTSAPHQGETAMPARLSSSPLSSLPPSSNSSRRRRRERLAAAVAGLSVVAMVAGGCSDATGSAGAADEGRAAESADDASDHRITIVTTVAPITSIVSNIVGDLADVVGIVPEGTNSHTFEPRPSVAELLATADVVYMNGLVLEEPTKRLAEDSIDADAEIVELGTLAITPDQYLYDFSFPESGGKPNPHLWTDPTLARRYAEIVTDDMSARDPANAAAYAANFEEFSAIIDEFDAAMRTSFATVPARQLLTYHDAYAYFAQTYDWEVVGAIQISDFEDPTPGEVADLIEQVRASGIPAIFGSEVFPSPVLAQIGREAGVEYIDVLRDDDLPGEPGDEEHSWLGLMRFDFVTMTEALGGDASALLAFDVRAAAPDTAKYPQ